MSITAVRPPARLRGARESRRDARADRRGSAGAHRRARLRHRPAASAHRVSAATGLSRVIRFAVVSVVAMIAVAVVIQAQQVAGQQLLDDVREESHARAREQADLRARLAEAESPSKLLDNAELLGMVEPAAVVAVPAAPSAVVGGGSPSATPDPQGRG